MARKIKFALAMKDGVEVHNIEELRKNFDSEKIVEYFLSGKLTEWLEDRYYDDEAEKISALDKNSPDLLKKICDALNAEYIDTELDKAINLRLNEKKDFLNKKTSDKSIIDNAAITALNQEDLAYLLDADESTIYLCGESFRIPIRVENKKYIGILGTPKIIIKADSWREIKNKNIIFVNVDLADNLKEPKYNATNTPTLKNSSSNITTNSVPKITTPPKPKFLPIHELKRILADSYFPPLLPIIHHKEKDYGDLWHIRGDQFHFIDERFKKIGDRDKEIALRLICKGRYNENDLVRIGVIILDINSRAFRLYAKKTDDKFWGFALTKDSLCLKGLYIFSRENFIIPYGNIKEVQVTGLGNLKIIFYKNKTETTEIIWDLKNSDKYTFEQLQKYLVEVKKYYSPDYDKLYIEEEK